jgi:hypothetical protein
MAIGGIIHEMRLVLAVKDSTLMSVKDGGDYRCILSDT